MFLGFGQLLLYVSSATIKHIGSLAQPLAEEVELALGSVGRRIIQRGKEETCLLTHFDPKLTLKLNNYTRKKKGQLALKKLQTLQIAVQNNSLKAVRRTVEALHVVLHSQNHGLL